MLMEKGNVILIRIGCIRVIAEYSSESNRPGSKSIILNENSNPLHLASCSETSQLGVRDRSNAPIARHVYHSKLVWSSGIIDVHIHLAKPDVSHMFII
jgi:hypothetical protein